MLASTISRQQDTEAYLAVLYAAIRKQGISEVLVSDNGACSARMRPCGSMRPWASRKWKLRSGKPGSPIWQVVQEQ
jgi:hypothetical protein